MTLETRPLTLIEANRFIQAVHRHHPKVAGHRYSIGPKWCLPVMLKYADPARTGNHHLKDKT